MSMRKTGRMLRLQFAGRELADLDFWTKSDPFLILSRPGRSTQGFVQVRKTETIMNNLNPNWRLFYISIKELCDDDFNMGLMLEVYDEDRNSRNDLIGQASLSLNQMLSMAGSRSPVTLIHPSKGQNKRGQIYIVECSLDDPDEELEKRKESVGSYPSTSRNSSFSKPPPPPQQVTFPNYNTPESMYNNVPGYQHPGYQVPHYQDTNQAQQSTLYPSLPPHGDVTPSYSFPMDPTDNRPPYNTG